MKLKKTMSLIVASSMIATMFSPNAFGAVKSNYSESTIMWQCVDGDVLQSEQLTSLENIDLNDENARIYVPVVDPSQSGAELRNGSANFNLAELEKKVKDAGTAAKGAHQDAPGLLLFLNAAKAIGEAYHTTKDADNYGATVLAKAAKSCLLDMYAALPTIAAGGTGGAVVGNLFPAGRVHGPAPADLTTVPVAALTGTLGAQNFLRRHYFTGANDIVYGPTPAAKCPAGLALPAHKPWDYVVLSTPLTAGAGVAVAGVPGLAPGMKTFKVVTNALSAVHAAAIAVNFAGDAANNITTIGVDGSPLATWLRGLAVRDGLAPGPLMTWTAAGGNGFWTGAPHATPSVETGPHCTSSLALAILDDAHEWYKDLAQLGTTRSKSDDQADIAASFLGSGSPSGQNSFDDYELIVPKQSNPIVSVSKIHKSFTTGGTDSKKVTAFCICVTPLTSQKDNVKFNLKCTLVWPKNKKLALTISGTMGKRAAITSPKIVEFGHLPSGVKIDKAAWADVKDNDDVTLKYTDKDGVEYVVEHVNGKYLTAAMTPNIGKETLSEAQFTELLQNIADAKAQKAALFHFNVAGKDGTPTLTPEQLGLDGTPDKKTLYFYKVLDNEKLESLGQKKTLVRAAAPKDDVASAKQKEEEKDPVVDFDSVVKQTIKDGVVTPKLTPGDYIVTTTELNPVEAKKSEDEKKKEEDAKEKKDAAAAEEEEEEEEDEDDDKIPAVEAPLTNAAEQKAAADLAAQQAAAALAAANAAKNAQVTIARGGATSNSIVAAFAMISLAGVVLVLKKGKRANR
ncbi:hypothetical protein FACS1894198_3220 [Clostridia bacterium]|nr:hypothetical protein FACS1894198_3220 [Clostridia bacterium]